MSLIHFLIGVINQHYYLQQQNLAQQTYNENKKIYEGLLRKLIAYSLNSISNSVKPFSELEKNSIYVDIKPHELYAHIPCNMDTTKHSSVYWKHLREYMQLSCNSILNDTQTEFDTRLIELSYEYMERQNPYKILTDYNNYYSINNYKLLKIEFSDVTYENGFVKITFIYYDNLLYTYAPNNIERNQNNIFVPKRYY